MYEQQIRFGARTRPYAVALSNGHTHVTYRQLDAGIDQVAAALRREGVGGPQDHGATVVGVALGDGYQHALTTLGAMRLGLTTTSLFPSMAAGMARLAGVTHLIAGDAALGPAVTADEAWFERARTAVAEPAPGPRLDLDTVARVQLSSGTTGTPKAVALSWRILLERAGLALSPHGMGGRALSMIGVESGGFGVWAGAWRNLGTALIPPASPAALAQALPILQPTTIVASPVQVAALADALDAIDARPLLAPPIISVAGGRVSRTVRDRLTLRLGAQVVPTYASTEAGTVAVGFHGAQVDERDNGHLVAGIVAEIVDDCGGVLGRGATGQLRIAGPGVVGGYADGQPSPAFRDGWFYPGDLGSVSADGVLRIAGRADELFNIGGEKVAPETLEEMVRPVAGVRDVAAFAMPGEAGDQPWLAVVRDGAVDEAAVARAITVPGLAAVKIAWIDAIPRTLMGKVRREELQAAARKL